MDGLTMKGWPWRMHERDLVRWIWVMTTWGNTPHPHHSHASPPRDYTAAPPVAQPGNVPHISQAAWISSFLQLPLLLFIYFTLLGQAVGGWQLGRRRRKETLAIERIGGDILDSIISFETMCVGTVFVFVCYFGLTQSSELAALFSSFWVEEQQHI